LLARKQTSKPAGSEPDSQKQGPKKEMVEEKDVWDELQKRGMGQTRTEE